MSLVAPGWIVKLTGHPFDLAYLEQSLRAPFDPWCERIPQNEEWVLGLRSHSFEHLTSADEVRQQAVSLIEQLDGAQGMLAGARRLSLGWVGHADGQGDVSIWVFPGTGRVEVRGGFVSAIAEVRDASGSLVPPLVPQPSQAQRWLNAAQANDDIADMLVFAGRADNWFDIYKALELAQTLAGGRPARKLNALLGESGDEFERMWRTANTHRHARDNNPPPTPMALREAIALLPFVIRTVLDTQVF